MKIIIDTREQKPLVFNHRFITDVEVKGLSVGDYGAMSLEYVHPVVFELKSINDLYGTLSGGYERFKAEIERAKEQNTKIIIIVEGHLKRILMGTAFSKRTPESIVYQLFTLRVRYDVETVFCANREEMAEYITQFYIAHHKEYLDKTILK